MAKKKTQKSWVLVSPKPSRPKIPDILKAEVEAKVADLIDNVLTARYVKPPPKDWPWNYLVGIDSKWHQGFFYVYGTYRSRGRTAITPTFETGLARMEYVGRNRFDLAYMRHTGKWHGTEYQRLTLDQCLDAIRDDSLFLGEP